MNLIFTSVIIFKGMVNEALMDTVILRTRDTPDPWLMACDANTEPETFLHKAGGLVKEP